MCTPVAARFSAYASSCGAYRPHLPAVGRDAAGHRAGCGLDSRAAAVGPGSRSRGQPGPAEQRTTTGHRVTAAWSPRSIIPGGWRLPASRASCANCLSSAAASPVRGRGSRRCVFGRPANLIDKSWLRLQPSGRYVFHELTRQFCAEKLNDEHRTAPEKPSTSCASAIVRTTVPFSTNRCSEGTTTRM